MLKMTITNILIIGLLIANIVATTRVHATSTAFNDGVTGNSWLLEQYQGGTNIDVAYGSTSRSPVWYKIKVVTLAQTSCGGTWHVISSATNERSLRSYVEVNTDSGVTIGDCPDSTLWQNRSESRHFVQAYSSSPMTYYGATNALSPTRYNQ